MIWDTIGHSHMKMQSGLSLIELTITISILGIIALVAIPNLTVTDPVKLDLAANKVADAIRFARSESIRTGQVHGVLIDHNDMDSTGKDIIVYQADLASSPFAVQQILRHPLSKQLYDISISENTLTANITITNNSNVFNFDTVGLTKHTHFNAEGRPVYYQDAVPYRNLSGKITVGNGTEERIISLNSITGRVFVQ